MEVPGAREGSPLILAVESSCDETALALLIPPRKLVRHVLFSQLDLHRPYGGVVPELASRAHLERLPHLFAELFSQCPYPLEAITHVAATRGPGLVNTLLVGLGFAQGFAYPRRLPFLGVNHLHGHLLSPDLVEPMVFPSLVFLATGGHTALYLLTGEDTAYLLKRTVDDAIGEAFDKVAKLLGLPYPGGPSIEKEGEGGDPEGVPLPLPSPADPRALSFSGLKTAVRRVLERHTPPYSPRFLKDLCASFQAVIAATITKAVVLALEAHPESKALYFVGGVARNRTLRSRLEELGRAYGLPVHFPPPELCTDNAAMIARAAWVRFQKGERDPWDLQPRSRWEIGISPP